MPGKLAGDAGCDEVLHRLGGGGEGHGGVLAELFEAKHGALAECSENAQGAGSSATGLLGVAEIGFKERDEAAGGFDRTEGCLFHAFEEEIRPGLPVTLGADGRISESYR